MSRCAAPAARTSRSSGRPSLIPRGIEATGVAVSHDIADIAAADVVYVLRMQRERMLPGEAYVPSLREYTLRYGVTAGAAAPGPARDAPGADEPRRRDRRRGRRLGRLADRREQVRAGPRRAHGRALRRLLAGRRGARRERSASRAGSDPGAPAPARTLLVRGARVLDPGEGIDARIDVLVRDGADRRARRRARRARRRRGRRGRRLHAAARRSSTRTCTCARPGRSTRRTSRPAPPRPPPAATAASSRCPTPIRWSTPPQVLESLHERAARRGARSRVGFLGGDLARPARRAARRARRARRRTAPCGYSDDGRPVLARRRCCGARCSTRRRPAGCSRCTARTRRSRARPTMHEGAVCARLGLGGYPSIAESTMIAPRPAHRPLREPPAPPLPPARRASRSRRCAARARSGVDVSRRGLAPPPAADRRGRALARRRTLQDEPAAGRRARTGRR